jgi:hypothetical protein
MTPIDALIRAQCDYYLDPVTPLLQAWYHAEGGDPHTFIKAIQCTYADCTTIEEALARGAKTIRSRIIAYVEFCLQGVPLFVLVPREGVDPWTGELNPRVLRFSDTFIEFLGARIAPVNVANDPTHLNEHWIPNVKTAYAALLAEVPHA